MASYEFKGHKIYFDRHGYRTRFYTEAHGYIGCYIKAIKVAKYWNPTSNERWEEVVAGPKTAAKFCLEKALVR